MTGSNRTSQSVMPRARTGGSALRPRPGASVVKRSIDITLAIVGLFVAAIPMTIIAVAVRASLGSPVVFMQLRPGLRGELFPLYKFRTMLDLTDAAGRPLPDVDRITPLGRLLRRTSLDELPELVNVLRGDMSIVGPRPLLVQYLPRYNGHQARRHEIRPGITGLAQVAGRNALPWEDRFNLDVWYVDNWSLRLDAWILVRTVWQVVRGIGVSQPGDDLEMEFMGTDPDRPQELVTDGEALVESIVHWYRA